MSEEIKQTFEAEKDRLARRYGALNQYDLTDAVKYAAAKHGVTFKDVVKAISNETIKGK